MANILFLTQVLPYPLNSGAKIRAYYVLRQLARSHAVTLVSFVREDDEPAAIAHLSEVCEAVLTVPMRRSSLRNGWALLKAGLTGRSVIIVRDEIPEMFRLLRRLVRDTHFDVIHADQTSMVQYALEGQRCHVQTFKRSNVQTILDAHNALYRIPERLAMGETNPLKRLGYRREARALQRYEAKAYRTFDHVVFVTEVDRRELQQVTSHKSQVTGQRDDVRVPGLETSDFGLQTSVIPICVDPEAVPLIPRRAGGRSVVHVGTMFWPPNVEGVLWFGGEVWPRVLQQVPDARFVIVGKKPPKAVKDLAMQVRNITVTGYVAEPAPYLAEAAVFIVPLHAGGGMRVKIVDAWCWGVPVVATTVGAEGIERCEGENILVADAPQALADAVVRLLKEPALGERLRVNGRAWVEEKYNWRIVYDAWDRVYEGLLAQRGERDADAH